LTKQDWVEKKTFRDINTWINPASGNTAEAKKPTLIYCTYHFRTWGDTAQQLPDVSEASRE